MKKMSNLLSTLLGFAVAALLLSAALAPLVQGALVTRTDQQAQARTAGDIDMVGRALFSWLSDQVGAAAAGQSQIAVPAPIQMTDYPVISPGGLTSLLVPVYLSEVPELDGWNHPYDFRLNAANPLAPKVMALRSPGRDGAYGGTSYLAGRFNPESFDEDIVWADGYAVRWPRSRTDREAQMQTLKDVQSIGAALFNWLTDQTGFAGTDETPVQGGPSPVQMTDYPLISYVALDSLLVPQYMPYLPERDGWENPFEFRLNTANPLAPRVMAIRSPGRNGTFSGDTYLVTSFDPDRFDEDIVWADGLLVRWPATGQGLSFSTLTPCRIFDTRPASALQSGSTTLFEIGAACGVPAAAKAVAVTITAVGPTGAGYMTLVPEGLPVPLVSTITFAAGQTRTNNAILSLSAGSVGSIEAKAVVAGNGQVHLVLDVTGYFE
ncbi:MAG TPA: hypothetical protein DD490_12350 [Acidobacteria bacterium]|nr:hypothetical protein [Acidobacteriota bacterium]